MSIAHIDVSGLGPNCQARFLLLGSLDMVGTLLLAVALHTPTARGSIMPPQSQIPISDVQPLQYSNTQLNVFYSVNNESAWSGWFPNEPHFYVLDEDNFSMNGSWQEVSPPPPMPDYGDQPVRITLPHEMTRGWLAVVISGSRPNGDKEWSMSAAKFPWDARRTGLASPGTQVPITLTEEAYACSLPVLPPPYQDTTVFNSMAAVRRSTYLQNPNPSFPGSGWQPLTVHFERTRNNKYLDFEFAPSVAGYYSVSVPETYWIAYDGVVAYRWREVSAYMRQIPQ